MAVGLLSVVYQIDAVGTVILMSPPLAVTNAHLAQDESGFLGLTTSP